MSGENYSAISLSTGVSYPERKGIICEGQRKEVEQYFIAANQEKESIKRKKSIKRIHLSRVY